MADSSSSIGRFIGRMARGVPNGFGLVFSHKARATSREEQVTEAHDVNGEESAWLDAHILADGQVDEYERALVAFIAEESGN